MAETAPYLFDRMFEVSSSGADISEASAAEKMRDEWERKMADACISSFEEGQAAGEAETLQRLEAETLEQTKQLVSRAHKIMGTIERECDSIRRNSIEIATVAADLLASELIARHPTLNTEALFRDALEHANEAPHIAITVNDAHAEQIQTIITRIASERGFAGKLVVLGDPETTAGDCSLQWADGGVTVNSDKIRAEILKLVRKHLDQLPEASKAASPAPVTDTEQSIVTASDAESGSGEMK